MKQPPANITTNPSQAIAKALADEIPASRLAKVLADSLSATTLSRSGTVEADTKSRLQGAALVLAYLVGRPVERQEILTMSADADSAVGMEERLRHSPALRALFRKMLARVDDDRPAIDA